VTRSEVQKRLLRAAADPQGPNVWILEPPCTSYCDFLLWSGGTRTFECPHGGSDGKPLTINEEVGNQISDFMVRLLKTLLKNKKFFLVENPARTGRYPSLWDMPEWAPLQEHKDVEVIPWSFCAWGMRPVDGERHEFHRKRTWGLAVRVPGLRDVLARACPGVSGAHVHVACKGNRPGTKLSRCREASCYPQEFCRGLAEALQQRLRVRDPAGADDSTDEHSAGDPQDEDAAQLREDSPDEHCQGDLHEDDDDPVSAALVATRSGHAPSALDTPTNHPQYRVVPAETGFISRLRSHDD
jgi:hypothetical protein